MGMIAHARCNLCGRPCVNYRCWRCNKNRRRNPVGAFRPEGMNDGPPVLVQGPGGVILASKLMSVKDDGDERARRVEIYRAWVEAHDGHLDCAAALAEAEVQVSKAA